MSFSSIIVSALSVALLTCSSSQLRPQFQSSKDTDSVPLEHSADAHVIGVIVIIVLFFSSRMKSPQTLCVIVTVRAQEG